MKTKRAFLDVLAFNTRSMLILIVDITALVGVYRLRLNPPTFSSGETTSWWGIALNLKRGFGYSLCNQYYFPFCDVNHAATAMREPVPVLLFSVIARIFGESLFAAGVMELLLFTGITITVFFLTRELAGPFTGLLAAVAWTVYPRGISLVPQVSGDLLAGLSVAFGILFVMRARKTDSTHDWLLAGTVFGIAAMSRSAMWLVPLTIVVGLLVERWDSRHRIFIWMRASFLVAVMTGLLILPWVIRTYKVFGRPLIGSSLVGYNIYRHNYVLGTQNYLHYVGNDEGWAAIQALLARRKDLRGNENEAEMDVVYRQEGLKIIEAHPVHYFLLSGYRFFMLWFDWRVSEGFGYPMGFNEYAMVVVQAVLLILAILGARKNPRKTWPLWASLIPVTLAYMAVDSRLLYIVPLMPLVICLSAAGIVSREWFPLPDA